MTKSEMLDCLKDEVTMSGSLNVSITDKEYSRVIDKETNMIYELYPEAVRYEYCILPPAVFQAPAFRRTRTIQFPECVLSVVKFEEMNRRNQMWGVADPDFSWNRMFQADLWMGPTMALDTVLFRTIQWSCWDQLKQFNLVDIKHTWNRSSHTLLVTGHDPFNNVFCEVATKVPGESLWEDPWVKQWISAKCKLQVAKKLGTFTVTGIGGVTINTNLYTEEANNDITDCKEHWKDMQQADFFCTGF